jgi:hypothetical protein
VCVLSKVPRVRIPLSPPKLKVFLFKYSIIIEL